MKEKHLKTAFCNSNTYDLDFYFCEYAILSQCWCTKYNCELQTMFNQLLKCDKCQKQIESGGVNG